jgi:hypothetical protein
LASGVSWSAWPRSPATSCCMTPSIARRSGRSGQGPGRNRRGSKGRCPPPLAVPEPQRLVVLPAGHPPGSHQAAPVLHGAGRGQRGSLIHRLPGNGAGQGRGSRKRKGLPGRTPGSPISLEASTTRPSTRRALGPADRDGTVSVVGPRPAGLSQATTLTVPSRSSAGLKQPSP